MAWILRHGIRKFQLLFNPISNLKHSGIRLHQNHLVPEYLSSSPYCKRVPHESSQFERVITEDLKSGQISTVFQSLCAANDCKLNELNKRTWGSVFYCLNQNGEYDKLDIIRNRTKDLDIKCGEGAHTTLINSYIKREKVTEAYRLLNTMKKEGLIRHSRTYFAVITSLANKGYHKEAFELFEEMQQHIFKSHKNVSLVIPSSMSVALIKSCIVNEYERAKSVLLFYNQSGWPLTLDIIEVIQQWLLSTNKWHECEISKKGLCNICHQFLDTIISVNNESLKVNIVNAIQDIFEEKQDQEWVRFKRYTEFLKEHGPYDIIIDGMNIGMRAKKHKNFNTRVLHGVAKHFIEQGKNILVLVNTSVPRLSFLQNDQFFVSDVGYDDLYIIYACAYFSSSFIVSSDKLREHRYLLSFEDRSHYLQWIRLLTIKVGVQKDILTFNTKYYDHVVQEKHTGWHFPAVNGKWFCAKKNTHESIDV